MTVPGYTYRHKAINYKSMLGECLGNNQPGSEVWVVTATRSTISYSFNEQVVTEKFQIATLLRLLRGDFTMNYYDRLNLTAEELNLTETDYLENTTDKISVKISYRTRPTFGFRKTKDELSISRAGFKSAKIFDFLNIHLTSRHGKDKTTCMGIVLGMQQLDNYIYTCKYLARSLTVEEAFCVKRVGNLNGNHFAYARSLENAEKIAERMLVADFNSLCNQN